MLLASANNNSNQFSAAAARSMGFKLCSATNVGSGGLATAGFVSHPALQRFRPNNDATTIGQWTGNFTSSMDAERPMPVKATVEWHIASDLSTQGGWYGNEFDQDQAEADAFFMSCVDLTTTIDVTPTLFPGVFIEPDTTFAAQDLNDGFQQETDDPWWSNVYGFPDYPPDFLAPPEASVEAIQAAHPSGGEHDFSTLVAEETSDYQSSISELETVTEWPPPPIDAELLGAQPSFADDFSTYVPDETSDYQNDTAVEAPWLYIPRTVYPRFLDEGYDPSNASSYQSALIAPAANRWLVVDDFVRYAVNDFQTLVPSGFGLTWLFEAGDLNQTDDAWGGRWYAWTGPTAPTPGVITLTVTGGSGTAQGAAWFAYQLENADPTDPFYGTSTVVTPIGADVQIAGVASYDPANPGDRPLIASHHKAQESSTAESDYEETGDISGANPSIGANVAYAPTRQDTTPSVSWATSISGRLLIVSVMRMASPPSDAEAQAEASPYGGEAFWPDVETEDYDPSISTDVSPFLALGVAVEPDETHAAQFLPADWLFDDVAPDDGDDPSMDVPTLFPSPPSDAELLAAQPIGDDLATHAEQLTEDYGPDPSLDTPTEWPRPPSDEELQAAQPSFADDLETYVPDEVKDYSTSSALDTPTEWFPPPSDAEAQAEQPHYGEAFWPDQETEDYADAITVDISAIFATPVEPVETLLAGPAFVENDLVTHVAEEPVDFQPYLSELETPTEWPPPPTDPELLAAQPSFGEHDFATLVPSETEDYANDSSIDVPTLVLAPPSDAEAQAAQPHYGELPILAEETEDYANDTDVDVSAFLAVPALAEPIETFAAQPPEQPFFDPAEETTDYDPSISVEVAPFFTPAVDEVLAAQPSYGELPIDPEETSDYANDSTLEIPALYPPPPTDAELLAAQPAEQPYFDPAEETTDYDSTVVLDVASAFAPTPDETIATQPFFGDLPIESEETTDYDGQPSIDVAPFLSLPVQDAELLGAQPHFGDLPETYVSAETEDYQADSTLDVTPTLFAPAAAEIFAAQPHYGEWFWEAQETEDYTGDSPLDVAAPLNPPAAIVLETIDIIGVPDGGVAVAGATETGVGISGVPEVETDLTGTPDAGISIIGVPDSGASAE